MLEGRWGTIGRKIFRFKGKRAAGAAGLVLILAMVLTAAGCSGGAYDKLMKAEAKTDAAVTGVTTTRITLENNFDTASLTAEELKMANYMKKVTYEGRLRFDHGLGEMASDLYLSMGGIGFDAELYSFGGETYVKLPVMKKYMNVKDLMKVEGAQAAAEAQGDFLSETALEKLGDIWSSVATPDNVKKTGSALLRTDSGDLKTTRYTVEVDPEVVQAALIESARVITEDLAAKNPDADFSSAIGEMTEIEIDEVSMISEISSSGYVVRDDVVIRYHQPGLETSIRVEIIRDQLDEAVELNLPEITALELYTSEELDREMPGALDDLLGTFGIQTTDDTSEAR
ncbi:hypothetical protein [Acidaminobacter sp.]|uniref:hypothetical protein n=1 Tax=Acidaminobacter sp. TaxID=1872102 RepID=UPI002566E8BC|nr:hypothetical protein [Acidaminobacter sp.]MDK9711337.1 hypothetical protein [Acidaminobacter sp.]